MQIMYEIKVHMKVLTGTSSSCYSSVTTANIIGKLQIDNISATYANLSIMFFQSVRHDLFEKNVEEGG